MYHTNFKFDSPCRSLQYISSQDVNYEELPMVLDYEVAYTANTPVSLGASGG